MDTAIAPDKKTTNEREWKAIHSSNHHFDVENISDDPQPDSHTAQPTHGIGKGSPQWNGLTAK